MKRAQIIIAAALVGFLTLVAVDQSQPLAYVRVCNFYRDLLARLGRKTPLNPDLVFLAIDSASVSLDEKLDLEQLYGINSFESDGTRPLKLMSQGWPWSREVYGLVLDRLLQAGAKTVIFDLAFLTPAQGDEPLRAALDRYKDRVVIGSNFVAGTSQGISIIHALPPETLVPQTVPMDDRVAFINFWPDPDDVVRRAQFRVTSEQTHGSRPQPDSEVFLSLAARALVKAERSNFVPSDLSDYAFRFTAPPREGFQPRSIFEIFIPDYWEHNYSFGEFFRGKIVLIGGEGNWQHDEHPTAFGSMPGPEIHLNVINAALHREFIHEIPPHRAIALVALAAVIAIALTLSVRSPWLRLTALMGVSAAGVEVAFLLFNYASVYVSLVPPLTELNLIGLLGLISDLVSEHAEKNHLRRTLEKYVSKNVVRELVDQPKAYVQSLGGMVRPVTILFSDIRGYSFVSARTDPQALVTQLNEYLTVMVDCVFRFGGTLDKFIGDAVMAVWGNTLSDGMRKDATNAVCAALAMRAELGKLNAEWAKRGLPELRFGVGINHGEVVVGNIGSPQRMEFTVIGDAVNVTWKLQELTKQFGVPLIVSKSVSVLTIEEFDLRPLGHAKIGSSPQPVEIFELCGTIELPQSSFKVASLLQ